MYLEILLSNLGTNQAIKQNLFDLNFTNYVYKEIITNIHKNRYIKQQYLLKKESVVCLESYGDNELKKTR